MIIRTPEQYEAMLRRLRDWIPQFQAALAHYVAMLMQVANQELDRRPQFGTSAMDARNLLFYLEYLSETGAEIDAALTASKHATLFLNIMERRVPPSESEQEDIAIFMGYAYIMRIACATEHDPQLPPKTPFKDMRLLRAEFAEVRAGFRACLEAYWRIDGIAETKVEIAPDFEQFVQSLSPSEGPLFPSSEAEAQPLLPGEDWRNRKSGGHSH